MWNVQVEGDDTKNLSRFTELEPTPTQGCTVLDTLVGTKQVRYGSKPSPENLSFMQGKIDQCVKADRPIEILSMWGGSKGYNQTPTKVADWLDVMALKRYACLQAAVKHTPGIRVTIMMEDFTGEVLRGPQGSSYFDSFTALVSCLGLGDFVTVIKESSTITDDPQGYLEQVHVNTHALLNDRPESVGWTGHIDWDHYLARLSNQFPLLSEAERRRKVGLYLGCTLARHQRKTIPPHDLKISFVPYPDSVPESFRKGRIEYKVKPNKYSQKTAAPWTCFGVLKHNDADWTHASVRDIRDNYYSVYDKGNLTINGLRVPFLYETKEVHD